MCSIRVGRLRPLCKQRTEESKSLEFLMKVIVTTGVISQSV
jgi:hypothetical protein